MPAMVKTYFRNRTYTHEPVWHLQVTMIIALVLQFLLPDRYVLGSRWVLITIEALLLIALSATTPKEAIFRSLSRRINVFLLIALSSAANLYSLVEVCERLLKTGHVNNGQQLILAGVNIYLTNLIIFGIWFWELDGGGPGQRRAVKHQEHDWLFSQQQNPAYEPAHWQPTFIDYLYLSSTNAMAFSPTDTLPLSRRAKLLMLAQSVISLTVVALVAARAVNILT